MESSAPSTTVINLKTETPTDYVYIGRPSKWGNPFGIGDGGTRSQVIEKYRLHVLGSPELMSQLGELRGKTLACYCKPLQCHGDVLADLADTNQLSELFK